MPGRHVLQAQLRSENRMSADLQLFAKLKFQPTCAERRTVHDTRGLPCLGVNAGRRALCQISDKESPYVISIDLTQNNHPSGEEEQFLSLEICIPSYGLVDEMRWGSLTNITPSYLTHVC